MPSAPVSVHVIPLEPVVSSNLAGIGYEDGTLAVKFKGGHIFHYFNVPERLWRQMQELPSKGSFYSKEIKGFYKADKVTGVCPKCAGIGYLGTSCAECITETFATPSVLG